MTDDTDRRIVEQVLKGDSDAFAGLVDKYKARIYNLAYRLSGSLHDADDLAQVVFIKAYESLHRYDPGRAFFPWLYTIALNTIRNHLKRNRFKAWLMVATTADGSADPLPRSNPEQQLLKTESLKQLSAALKKLPYRQRAALVLRFFEQCTYKEIAGLQKVSVSAAKMRVRRGMGKLASMMGRR